MAGKKLIHFSVVSGSALKVKNGEIYGYGPYIKELNLWLKYVDEVTIVAPISKEAPSPIDLKIEHAEVNFNSVPEFSLIGFKNLLRTLSLLPSIGLKVSKAMRVASHIHLRCPSNLGLIGSFIQLLFPSTIKTAKYAANWDPQSKQPWSYKLQQKILKNTAITKNMQVLVYGNWPDKTANILPFFTASYVEADKVETPPRTFAIKEPINLIYVGSLSENKKPLLALEVLKILNEKGIKTELNMYGKGAEQVPLEAFINENALNGCSKLHGARPADEVKEAFKKAHFLVFISKSEGWPKVVAESMFWGCYPITTKVSMVPEMLGNEQRGTLVNPNVEDVVEAIEASIKNPEVYREKCIKAMAWSRQYTIEKLETELAKLV